VRAIRPHHLITLLLLGVIALFGWRVVRVVLHPIQPAHISAAGAEAEIPQAELPPAPRAPEDGELSELNERPPFWESRRPFQEAPPPEEPPKELPKIAVAGIVHTGAAGFAFLIPEGKPTVRVKAGESVEGWNVVAINREAVVLKGGEEEVTLKYDPRQRFAAPPPPGNDPPQASGLGPDGKPIAARQLTPAEIEARRAANEQRREELERRRRERQAQIIRQNMKK